MRALKHTWCKNIYYESCQWVFEMGEHLAFTKDIGGMNQSKFYEREHQGRNKSPLRHKHTMVKESKSSGVGGH